MGRNGYRAIQRQAPRRAAQERDLVQPARGSGADRGLAPALQHRPAPFALCYRPSTPEVTLWPAAQPRPASPVTQAVDQASIPYHSARNTNEALVRSILWRRPFANRAAMMLLRSRGRP
jgi:hypothetical protein